MSSSEEEKMCEHCKRMTKMYFEWEGDIFYTCDKECQKETWEKLQKMQLFEPFNMKVNAILVDALDDDQLLFKWITDKENDEPRSLFLLNRYWKDVNEEMQVEVRKQELQKIVSVTKNTDYKTPLLIDVWMKEKNESDEDVYYGSAYISIGGKYDSKTNTMVGSSEIVDIEQWLEITVLSKEHIGKTKKPIKKVNDSYPIDKRMPTQSHRGYFIQKMGPLKHGVTRRYVQQHGGRHGPHDTISQADYRRAMRVAVSHHDVTMEHRLKLGMAFSHMHHK